LKLKFKNGLAFHEALAEVHSTRERGDFRGIILKIGIK
jgi:hypothetical protein